MKARFAYAWTILRWLAMLPATFCVFLITAQLTDRFMVQYRFYGVTNFSLEMDGGPLYHCGIYFFESFVPALVCMLIAPSTRMYVGVALALTWVTIVPFQIGSTHPMALVSTFLAMGLVHWGEQRIARRRSTPSAL